MQLRVPEHIALKVMVLLFILSALMLRKTFMYGHLLIILITDCGDVHDSGNFYI